MGSTLLVIDSSPAIRRLVEQGAQSKGYRVVAFSDGPSVLDEADKLKPDIIIADYHLEGLTFKTFCDKLNTMDLIPDTQLVVLINASDRYDEEGLRSRGVRGFLQKPLQPEKIEALIEELTYEHQQAHTAKKRQVSKSWPPEVTVIDSDDTDSIRQPDSQEVEAATAIVVTQSSPVIAGEHKTDPEEKKKTAAAASAAAAGALIHRSIQGEHAMSHTPPSTEGATPQDQGAAGNGGFSPHLETAMRGLLSELVQSTAGNTSDLSTLAAQQVAGQLPDMIRAEVSAQVISSAFQEMMANAAKEAAAQLIPAIVTQHVADQLPGMVQADVAAHVASAFSPETILNATEVAAQQIIPTLVAQHANTSEESLRKSLSDQFRTTIQELTERSVKDLTEQTIQQELPNAVKQHLGSMDTMVKEIIQETSQGLVKDSVEGIVRELAEERVGQMVRTLVPEMAENQVKQEIERLTAPA